MTVSIVRTETTEWAGEAASPSSRVSGTGEGRAMGSPLERLRGAYTPKGGIPGRAGLALSVCS
ncbi:MAG: hypothetical protein L0L69_10330, partial [Propionibacterium sp.]|nr:hypothetical protein [Propionibacterium sp.]